MLPALILLLGLGGYLFTSTTIGHDRDAAAARRAQLEAVRAQEVLGRARAYVAGLANVLAGETNRGQREFVRLAAGTSASVGLDDVLWVQRVPRSDRDRYERLRGAPITRLTPSGRFEPAPPASMYFPATFTSLTRSELHPGVDVAGFPSLAAAIGDRARIFAVGASRPGALGAEPGFYLLEAASYAGGPDNRGYLAAFVPRGWFTTTLGGDPRQLAISEGGRRIDGSLGSADASASFETLGRRWRITVGRDPPSGLQSALPWLALAWPFAAAVIAFLVGRAVTLRRRAQRQVERVFELSRDLLAIVGFDGRYRAVNPEFERTLGYSSDEVIGRSCVDFVHPDDAASTRQALADVVSRSELEQFENRCIRADGSARWLEWSGRAVPDESVIYATGRDVTERRRIDSELRQAQRTAEARGAELQALADEQAALRRVATLIAREASQAEVFTSVAEEIGRLLGAEEMRMLRYEEEHTALVVASWGANEDAFPVGSRHSTEGDSAASRVLRTGRSARIDDYEQLSGPIAETVRTVGIRSSFGAPILVEGRLWGAMVTGTAHDQPLPADTESRLSQFTELMATAIANAESHATAVQLAEERAALGRVATLIAKEASLTEVFARVAEEVANLLGDVDCALWRDDGDGTATAVAIWGASVSAGVPVGTRLSLEGDSLTARVLREGAPGRIRDYSAAAGPVAERAREIGIRSAVSCPIVVGRRTWGAMAVGTFAAEPLPPETETRIAQFSDLVATAIANTDARAEVERLAEEQAALRRVATLVAQRAQPAEIFAAVGEEVGRVFGLDVVMVSRFDPDGPAHVIVGVANRFEGLTVGSRFELDESMASAAVYRTGRSARVDGVDWSAVSAPSGEVARRLGSVSAVSSPIVVEGRLWGAITMADKEPLPLHAEARLEQFTRLVGTAVAGAESREALKELADEQAALRRVATLVAKGAPATAVFDAVAAEVERLLGADGVTLSRYEPDDQVRVVAHRGPDVQRVPPGTRVTHRGQDVATMVRRSERTARLEHHEKTRGAVAQLARDVGVRASVGAPIVVDGRLWGVVIATWRGEQSPPADTQARMAKFAQLLDTAVANADSRDQLTASRARLLTEADAARRHVVRDLHDGAQQRLVQTIVTLRLAEQALEEEDGNAHSLVAAALEQAEQGNAELRELAQGILPPVLTRGGLRAAVRSVVRRLDLPVEVDIPSDRFSPAIEASAYFIVAEALTNVVKHAQADRAVVKASVEGARLRLEVRDDGIGGADPDGHGLLGIADRVTALGGRLDVDSPAGVGTVLCATLPLAEG